MPYGQSIYGISQYGQLELPLFDKVGGLMRYTPQPVILGLIRSSHADYPNINLTRTSNTLNWTANRYGQHVAGISLNVTSEPLVSFGLIRSSNYIQLRLDRTYPATFEKVLLVRNWTDITRT